MASRALKQDVRAKYKHHTPIPPPQHTFTLPALTGRGDKQIPSEKDRTMGERLVKLGGFET